jgi:hypothetical protein
MYGAISATLMWYLRNEMSKYIRNVVSTATLIGDKLISVALKTARRGFMLNTLYP